MSEVTVSLVKAKREDVTGTEVAGRKTKIEQWTGTERLFLAAKDPQLAPTCGPPALLMDDVPISTGEKKLLPHTSPPPAPHQELSLGNDSVAHGLGLNHAPLAHIRVLCPDQDMEMFQSWGGSRRTQGPSQPVQP